MKSILFKISFLLLCFNVYAANEIYITQVGTSNNFTLDILQDGDDNEIRLSVSHDSNNLDFDQIGDNNTISWVSYWGSGLGWGGDLDGSSNTINLCQGKTFVDSDDTTCEASTTGEYGGHTIDLDIHAGNTDLKGSQETGTGNADHYARIYTYNGDNNDIFFKQKGNGNKTLHFIVRTDNGEQEMIQKGDGVHTATIDLTGSYTTDLSLTQNSNSNQTYTLTNNCQTSSGCDITVTQN